MVTVEEPFWRVTVVYEVGSTAQTWDLVDRIKEAKTSAAIVEIDVKQFWREKRE